jgi:basic membrane protein A
MTRVALLSALLALLLTSCDRNAAPLPAAPKKFRVALILPGSENDKGWNQMAREGLDLIAKKTATEQPKMVSNVSASEFASQIKYFADEGFDVVICHGGEFEKAVAAAARTYPKTRFIVGGCPNDIPGANAVEFTTKEASVLVGVVAGKITQAKTVAFVGAMPVPPLQACYDGMKAGLPPDVKLLAPQWTNSWDSPTAAKEKTEAALAAGADVIYQNVDAAAKGVFEAVQAANKPDKPTYAFGCNRNQNADAPDVIVGSVVLDVPRAYLDLAKKVKKDNLPAGALKLGLKEGYVDLVLNDKHPKVTAELKDAVEARRKELMK